MNPYDRSIALLDLLLALSQSGDKRNIEIPLDHPGTFPLLLSLWNLRLPYHRHATPQRGWGEAVSLTLEPSGRVFVVQVGIPQRAGPAHPARPYGKMRLSMPPTYVASSPLQSSGAITEDLRPSTVRAGCCPPYLPYYNGATATHQPAPAESGRRVESRRRKPSNDSADR